MTFEVQQTRWDRIVRRVSGSIGPGSRVGETLSELFPVLDVERVPGELLILGGTHICWGSGRVNQVAGELGFTQLENPADSGTIATVTTFMTTLPVGGILRWGRSNTALGTQTGGETWRDSRRLVTERPTCKIRSGSQVAVVGGTGVARITGGFTFVNTDPNDVTVLAPGTVFEVGSEAVNTTFFATIYWRERPAEQSELSL